MTGDASGEVLRELAAIDPLPAKDVLRDLAITFPALRVEHVPDHHSKFAREEIRAFVDRTEQASMPDGYPILGYREGAAGWLFAAPHGAFEAWLNRRGWYSETDDGLTYYLLAMRLVT